MAAIRRVPVALLILASFASLARADEEPILGKSRDQWLEILQKDEKPRMRKAAVIALGIYGPGRKEVFPTLLKALGTEKEAEIRLQILSAIGQVNAKTELRDALGALADVLKDDKSASVKASAAALIGNLGEFAKPALNLLINSLKDPDPAVRAACAEAIGKIGEEAAPDAVNPLLPLLKDGESTVRFATVYAYGRIGPESSFVVPDLLQVLEKDADDDIRREVVRSLALMGNGNGKLVIPTVLKALDEDKSVEVRREIAVKLPKFGNLKPLGMELVGRLKAEKDRGVRLYLARSIPAGLGDVFKDHVKDYADWLGKEPEADIRFAMVQEIGALGLSGRDALDALMSAESDVVLQVREAAREAVQQVKGIAKKDPKKK